jgi:thiol-disulfide isomerase/thioredoxin
VDEVGVTSGAEGPEEGQVLADFSIECLDGSTFSIARSRGKVTIVNLWATYCEPCVKELPYFADLYHDHPDDIALVAVHAPRLSPNVDTDDFVADLGLDFPVAVDTEEVDVCGIVGSDGATLPQTVVLDREGRVVYNKVGSVTPELLEQLFEEASG